MKSYSTLLRLPAPYYSVLMDGCLETGRDLSCGLKYNNFGIHGAASSSAADALAAVQKPVFTDQSVQPEEPLNAMNANFEGYEALQDKLLHEAHDVHVLLDTSGYAQEDDFRRVVEKSDFVYFDLKLIDRAPHLRHTGVDNERILTNLHVLTQMNVPFVIRVPLIPGVTATAENLEAIARTAKGLAGLIRVDLLPYNRAAGGKSIRH